MRTIPLLSVLLALLAGCHGKGSDTTDTNGSDTDGTDTDTSSDTDTDDTDDTDLPPLSATVDPASGADLGLRAPVTLTFNRAVDASSVALSGTLADDGTASWTDATHLVVTPKDTWDATRTDTLTVTVGGGAFGDYAWPVPLVLSTFQEAAEVIGQPDFTSAGVNRGGAVGPDTLQYPAGTLAFAGGRTWLSDGNNHRVLGFDGLPDRTSSAVAVLGQAGFTTNDWGGGASSLDTPQAVLPYDGGLVVDDYGNGRLAVYATTPTSGGGASASWVVGQAGPDAADTTCDAATMDSPEAFTIVGGKLIVADSNHNRVLIWNTVPTTSGTPADLVLGQGSFTTCAAEDDDQDGVDDAGVTARTLGYPCGVWSDGTRLAVIDNLANRVLIWNTFPTSSFAPADVVLGQSDFTHFVADDDDQDGVSDGHPSARTFEEPYMGIVSNGTQLFVTIWREQRVLVWDHFPTTSFAPADHVLGQSDFEHAAANDDDQDGEGGLTPTARVLRSPSGLTLLRDRLVVADGNNNRYLEFVGQ